MEETRLEFSGGFIAVTGETGAGKSVLLGALSLLAGNRADKTVIRQGAEACAIEAVLHFPGEHRLIDDFLRSNDLPPREEECLILHRELSRTKGGRVRINGALATLSQLQELGGCWIDFHGPGEPQKLFHEHYQREMLDLYARNDERLSAYGDEYDCWRNKLKEIDKLTRSTRLNEDEIAFIESQLAGIEALDPTPESITELERQFNRVTRARDLMEYATQLEQGLAGDGGLTDALPPLIKAAAALESIDDQTAPLTRRLESLAVELQDLASDYAALVHEADLDEETAATVQERMRQWLELKRRHGPDPVAVQEKAQTLRDRLARGRDIDGTLERLRGESQLLEKSLREKATELNKHRTTAARALAKKVQPLLLALGFKKADIRIEVNRSATLQASGDSEIAILFSPNPGQSPLPLNRIASSGETARVMLALKAVLAEVDATPVLVFDEVDANVGGEIGAAVGRELASLSGRHQVFCVTHLPQVAAQASSHFLVSKDQDTTSTQVIIQPIHDDQSARVSEVARMLGDRKSASALGHARELLS